jgi:hypothetical protein
MHVQIPAGDNLCAPRPEGCTRAAPCRAGPDELFGINNNDVLLHETGTRQKLALGVGCVCVALPVCAPRGSSGRELKKSERYGNRSRYSSRFMHPSYALVAKNSLGDEAPDGPRQALPELYSTELPVGPRLR